MREFWRRIRSAGRFFKKWIANSWAALIVVFMQFTSFYTNVVKPVLSGPLLSVADVVIGFASAYWGIVVAAILVYSAARTYDELDQQIRDPKLTKALKGFYLQFGELLSRDISSDEAVEQLKKDKKRIGTSTYEWVEANMDKSSLIRLTQDSPSSLAHFGVQREDAHNAEHSQLIDNIIRRQERLAELIETPVWT